MPGLVLQALTRDDTRVVRVGYTATRKLGGAVTRNRAKRRLREAARLLLSNPPETGADLVLVGRGTTANRAFRALLQDLAEALRRAGVA